MGLFGKKAKTEVPKVETAAQKKDREAKEEAAAFKKRAGKVSKRKLNLNSLRSSTFFHIFFIILPHI